MSIDWDSLVTLEQWASVLRDLLHAAAASVRSRNVVEQGVAHQDLVDFVLQSPNTIALELDELARGALDDIMLSDTDEALTRISGHLRQLAVYLPK
jgi:hypothetical protein